MSCTSLYELFGTKVNCIAELHNGHGSGPAIWDYISNKLRGKDFSIFDDDKNFWPLYKDARLDDDERAVLLSTYDRAFIEVDRLNDFAEACQKIHPLIIETTRLEWSHFEAIGKAAEELYRNHDYRCKGLAIGCTSVCDIWEQESTKDIDSWGVYAQIDAIKADSKVA